MDRSQLKTASKENLFSRWLALFKPREPINGFSHLIGVFLSLIGLYLLIKNIPRGASISYIVSLYVFGISLILLYTASTSYHLLSVSPQAIQIMRRIDHMMIYVLIAGTYTPICMIVLDGWLKWVLLLVIWFLAIIGIILKIFWFNSPRWLSTLFYIVMGWLVVIAIFPISQNLALKGTIFLVTGGLLYTFGALIYATKWPRIPLNFLGFHEIFHLFVLGGSFCHYWLILRYVVLV